jgi:hypothetical protein
MSEVRAQILDRLGSFKLSDGVLEVALVKFTRVETDDWWVQRVVDYIPDGMQHPTNRMFLTPPRGWEREERDKASTVLFKQR